MNNSFPNANPSESNSKKIDSLLEQFNLYPDLELKERMLLEQNSEVAKSLINKIPFENLTMILDECPNLDTIFSFLELVYTLNEELSNRLMEYLFLLEGIIT